MVLTDELFAGKEYRIQENREQTCRHSMGRRGRRIESHMEAYTLPGVE